MFDKLYEEIVKHPTIIVHRHFNPDGDAIGSQVGLCDIIKQNFPEKKVYMVGDDPGRYGFIENSTPDDITDDKYENALAILLDASDPKLISDERYKTAKRTARIDHHMFIGAFCDTEVIDSTFESCAGLVGYFAMQKGLKLSPVGAKALFTGMVTDSGRFRYDSTTARTFKVAAFLMENDFSTADIYANLYRDDLDMVRLRANFTLKAQFTKNNVGYIYTDYQEFLTYGVSSFTISRGMVNVMAEIKGVDIWVNFTETNDSVLCEIRSLKYDINKIAVKYGGGGHKLASGATLKSKDEAMLLLNDLDLLIERGEL